MKKQNIFMTILLWIYGQFVSASIYFTQPNAWDAAQKVFKRTPDDYDIWHQKRRAIALQIWIQECRGEYSLLRELPQSAIAGHPISITAAIARLEVITEIKAAWQIWRNTDGAVKEAAHRRWRELIDVQTNVAHAKGDMDSLRKLLAIAPIGSPEHQRLSEIVRGGSPLELILEEQAERRQRLEHLRGLKKAA